jgi:hypothetical protein
VGGCTGRVRGRLHPREVALPGVGDPQEVEVEVEAEVALDLKRAWDCMNRNRHSPRRCRWVSSENQLEEAQRSSSMAAQIVLNSQYTTIKENSFHLLPNRGR